MLLDMLFTVSAIGFFMSDIKQLHKVWKYSYETNAISRTHLKIKIFSLSCIILGYSLCGFYASVSVSVAQLAMTLGILYFTLKRYNHEA